MDNESLPKQSEKKIRYLNYYKIKDSKSGPIEVKCYTDYTSLWVCPNPFNKECCEYIEKAFNPPPPVEPFFLKMVQINITQEMFDNQDNWKF